jgi:hypothetical protein
MRKYLITTAAAVTASLALMVTGSYASAQSVDVLTYGSAGGTNVSVNDVLSSSLQSGTNATFYTATSGTTGGTCSSGSISESVTSNPTEGGTADTSVSSQSFSSCADNLSFTIDSMTMNSGYTAELSQYGVSVPAVSATIVGSVPIGVEGANKPGTIKKTAGLNEICPGSVDTGCGLTVDCYYTGSGLSGSNVFTNQELVATSESNSDCPSVMYFSATYGTLVDSSVTGDPTVYVNS